MTVVLALDGVGRDQLFSLLLSFHKLLASVQGPKELELLQEYWRRVCDITGIVSRELLLPGDSWSESADDGSAVAAAAAAVRVCPWPLLPGWYCGHAAPLLVYRCCHRCLAS